MDRRPKSPPGLVHNESLLEARIKLAFILMHPHGLRSRLIGKNKKILVRILTPSKPKTIHPLYTVVLRR
jgi:hypothetical protein